MLKEYIKQYIIEDFMAPARILTRDAALLLIGIYFQYLLSLELNVR